MPPPTAPKNAPREVASGATIADISPQPVALVNKGGFCNGPWVVNPSCSSALILPAEVLLLSAVGAWPLHDGI
jgi:hypothetical protein